MRRAIRIPRRTALLACGVLGCMPVALGQQIVNVPEIRMTGNRAPAPVSTASIYMTGNRMPVSIQTTAILMVGNRLPQTINTQPIVMTGNRGIEEP